MVKNNKPKPGTQVIVDHLPMCDLCGDVARYDGKTRMGPWANMCVNHFLTHGTGLGTGKGQQLVLAGE